MVGPVPGIKQNLLCTSFRIELNIQTMTTTLGSLDRLYSSTGFKLIYFEFPHLGYTNTEDEERRGEAIKFRSHSYTTIANCNVMEL